MVEESDRGGLREDREDYLKMYQHLRTEAESYHQAMWKLQFGTVIAAAAVASFVLAQDRVNAILGGLHAQLLLLSGLAFAIGVTGAVITHMYALYYETTHQVGNVYRNAWLRGERRSVLFQKLQDRNRKAYRAYQLNFKHSLRWTFPSVAVALAGLGLAACATLRPLP